MVDDLEWLRAKDREMRAQQARELEAAKAAAAARGKQPFDYTALCEIYDPTSDLGVVVHDPAERARALEARYYLDCPDVLDLAAFAERMRELDTWR